MTVQELGDTMTWFYTKPNLTTFEDIAHDLATPPQVNRHVEDLFAVFIWRCVEKYGYEIPTSPSGDILDRARDLLDPNPTSRWAASIREPVALSTELLDVNWMSYFATGDTLYLSRILAAARHQPAEGYVGLTCSMARWSFKDNCRQHPTILQFARKQRSDSSDADWIAFLDDCIKFAVERNKAESTQG